MKKLISIVMCSLIILLSVSVFATPIAAIVYKDVAFKLFSTQQYVDGSVGTIFSSATGLPVRCELVPKQAGGKAMIPLRAVSEAFGANVIWDGTLGDAGGAIIKLDGKTLTMNIGSRTITRVVDSTGAMDTITISNDFPETMIIDHNTHVPLRVALEAFGYSVDYRADGDEEIDGEIFEVGYCLITNNPAADAAYFDELGNKVKVAFQGGKAIMKAVGVGDNNNSFEVKFWGNTVYDVKKSEIYSISVVSLDTDYLTPAAFIAANPTWDGKPVLGAWDVTDPASRYKVYAWYVSDGEDWMYSVYLGGKDGVTAPSLSNNLFSNFHILSIIDLSALDTSDVTNMSGMFYGCAAHVLDLSRFDTSKVTNMSWMFTNAGIRSIDLSSFDTSNVTDMSGMFSGKNYDPYTFLENIDFSKADFSNVTSYDDMFFKTSPNLTVTVNTLAAKAFIQAAGIPAGNIVIA